MAHRRARLVVASALVGLAVAVDAAAQVVGTFPWQLQPYCNLVTLTLTNTPVGWRLDGTDDQCGAPDRASAFGHASFNATGHVRLNFTIVAAPSGTPVHVSALVSTTNGQGTWSDSVGNSGAFVFFGSTPGLPPRPSPASGLRPGSVTSVDIAPGAVGAPTLAPNAVTGIAVADGSLTAADLADGPRGAFAEGAQVTTLPIGVYTVVRDLTMNVPAAGRVIASAGGEFRVNSGGGLAVCSLTTGTTVDIGARNSLGSSTTSALYLPMGMTRGFAVAPGPLTVRLVCQGALGSTTIVDPSLTAMFFPE